ncbi:MAG: ankyrin repeat domain-containing protein [Acidobacteriota bacterium]|nr:ankyrin repeat domain-containing protein [Acidobacteriota bacterium]
MIRASIAAVVMAIGVSAMVAAASSPVADAARLRGEAASAGPAEASEKALVAEAAERGDKAAVRALIKQAADINAAQGDGMTALHWAAMNGDAELAQMLVYAGANVKATTRIGSYTPLYIASQQGNAAVLEVLVKAGADAKAGTANGTTPLMAAAQAGNVDAVQVLIAHGADVNAKDGVRDQTPLMYAAAANRAAVIELLAAKGANLKATSKVTDLSSLTREGAGFGGNPLVPGAAAAGQAGGGPPGRPQALPEPGAPARRAPQPGIDRNYQFNEMIGAHGGLTPLLFAARQGYTESVDALLKAGADVNQISAGDKSSPLIMAVINGHFDIAQTLINKGANVNGAAMNGVTPLYGVLNVEWAPKALYPQPRAHMQQKLGYLDLMKQLLDKGVDPNARLKMKVWYSGYSFDLSGVDEIGATAFWRAAYASDVAAMRLLVAVGADPNLPTMKPAGRARFGDMLEQREVRDLSGLPEVPIGGPSVMPLHAAAGVGYGEGFGANSHRFAPTGMMAAVKYLVEELGADVNAADHEGNTALHHAAARGDNEMILYLVSKGANAKAVDREGRTTADMANGPVQRIQPFPETIALLEKLGAKNNHKCVSC